MLDKNDLYNMYQESVEFWCNGIWNLPEETRNLVFGSEMFLLLAYTSNHATVAVKDCLNDPGLLKQMESRPYSFLPVVIPHETKEEAEAKAEQERLAFRRWKENHFPAITDPSDTVDETPPQGDDVLILGDSLEHDEGSVSGNDCEIVDLPRIKTIQRRSGLVRQTPDGVIRLCRICGNEFHADDMKGRAFCSPECESAADFNANRMEIFARDNHTCVYCGASPFNSENVVLHVDHIVPFAKGGATTADNLVTSCNQCNLSKSSKDLQASVLESVLGIVAKRNRENEIDPSKFYHGLERQRDSE